MEFVKLPISESFLKKLYIYIYIKLKDILKNLTKFNEKL
jgi:hypothetical protein